MTQNPPTQLYEICIPHSGRDYYVYQSESACLEKGMRVEVPFRKSSRIGLCLGPHEQPIQFESKPIQTIIDNEPILSDELLTLCQWVSHYYQSPLSEVLPLMLPKKYRAGKPAEIACIKFYSLKIAKEQATTHISTQAHKQLALIQKFSEKKSEYSKKELTTLGFSSHIIQEVASKGLLKVEKKRLVSQTDTKETQPFLKLNHEQDSAVKTITKQLNQFQCYLLEGITGSGKTEVYLHVINTVLGAGKQVLILVPEIGLTPQLIARFKSRFSQPLAVLHSNLNDTERQQAWQLAKENIAKLVLGTRSAVFTPLPDLGLVVVDEEHDASFKQIDGVRYSGRDTAVFRAQRKNIPIILGSATPSLESIHNCQNEKYKRLKLSTRAISTASLDYEILDIRNKLLQHGLAEQTLKIIKKHVEDNNQVLIFINRRGFSPVLLCHQCGWMVDCKACDSHMTFHQEMNRLICHHCGLVKRVPDTCQSCHSPGLLPIGTGTQRVYQFLQTAFPEYSISRVDRDVTHKKHALKNHLEAINRGETQIIVGTQMLAKGHHFPNLTCVVVLDADNGFYNQDFRALERLGQLITQVSGRAGREDKPGKVLIQTHLPHHPMLNLLITEGYATFAEKLLHERKQANLPPTSHMAILRAQGKSINQLLEFLHAAKKELASELTQVLGPAPAPLARKSNQHRMQLLLKSSNRKALHLTLTHLRTWLTMNKLASGIRWNIDVDPVDLS